MFGACQLHMNGVRDFKIRDSLLMVSWILVWHGSGILYFFFLFSFFFLLFSFFFFLCFFLFVFFFLCFSLFFLICIFFFSFFLSPFIYAVKLHRFPYVYSLVARTSGSNNPYIQCSSVLMVSTYLFAMYQFSKRRIC